MRKWLLFLMTLALPGWALESTKPPNPVNSLQIGLKIATQVPKNSRIRIKGACLWLVQKVPPKVRVAPAITQFVPDLVVTVSNNPGENPWIEARQLLENKWAVSGYQRVYQGAVGYPLGFGNDSTLLSPAHFNEGHSRVVSVFGAPTHTFQLPGMTHSPETAFPSIYYSSLADAVMERTQAAELAYMATHPNLLVGHEIGTSTNYWGFEMPRMMYVNQPYRFRASVVAAMHAADIVTNQMSLHLGHRTTNRCGKDCIIANVIYDPNQKNVIWQEVYPNNRLIKPGDANDFGLDDEKKGHGNYLFVVWRKYGGCVEQEGTLLQGVGMGKPPRR